MKRRYLADRVYTTADKKWDAVVGSIAGQHQKGRPVLVGTRSVEASEHLSELLTKAELETIDLSYEYCSDTFIKGRPVHVDGCADGQHETGNFF